VELRHFRYFIAVAEELHFGRAATRLHMSQQPLSAQIRSLEQEIGAELFHRAENRIRLTEAGKVFLIEARGAVDAADRAISRTRDAAEGRSGILRVGYCATAVGDTLTRTLERLSTQRPALRFELFDCHGDDAIVRLREHEIDLAIAHVPADPRGLEHVPLFAEPYLIGVRDDNLLAKKAPLSPLDLSGRRIVSLPRSTHPGVRDAIEEWLGTGPSNLAITFEESRDVQGLVTLVQAGVAAAIVPRHVANEQQSNIAWIPLKGSNSEATMALIWRRNEQSILIKNFISAYES